MACFRFEKQHLIRWILWSWHVFEWESRRLLMLSILVLALFGWQPTVRLPLNLISIDYNYWQPFLLLVRTWQDSLQITWYKFKHSFFQQKDCSSLSQKVIESRTLWPFQFATYFFCLLFYFLFESVNQFWINLILLRHLANSLILFFNQKQYFYLKKKQRTKHNQKQKKCLKLINYNCKRIEEEEEIV